MTATVIRLPSVPAEQLAEESQPRVSVLDEVRDLAAALGERLWPLSRTGRLKADQSRLWMSLDHVQERQVQDRLRVDDLITALSIVTGQLGAELPVKSARPRLRLISGAGDSAVTPKNPRTAADLDGRRRSPEARMSPNGATNR